MELQCDVCCVNFDVDLHRPKVLVCGHTICKECTENPALQRKCPTCRKGMGRNLPDNISLIQLIEQDEAPPRKKSKTGDTAMAVQQLQRGVDAGKKVVEQLRRVVPLAVEALNCQLDSSLAQLRQMEEALEQQVQRQREAGGGDSAPLLDLTEQLLLAGQLEHSLRLLTTKKCSVVAEEEDGAAWRASEQMDVVRVLLLKLQTDGQLEKVVDVAVPANPAAFVGPPLVSSLVIQDKDLDAGCLKVNDIIRDRARWRNVRSIRNLQGEGFELLLRVLAPQLHLEELEINNGVSSRLMEEVQKMGSLKRLDIMCKKGLRDDPPLPLHLEELRIYLPTEKQLRCVERMPKLRSLSVNNYLGLDIAFAPSRQGALRYLFVAINANHKATMLSLIRSHASSLEELRIVCSAGDGKGDGDGRYFPELGQDLAASGLQALRRLVLKRPSKSPCPDQVGACMLQRQTIQSFLPSFVGVICYTCNLSEF